MNRLEDGVTVVDIYRAIDNAHEELHPERELPLDSTIYVLVGVARDKARRNMGEAWRSQSREGGRRGHALLLTKTQSEEVIVEFGTMVRDAKEAWDVPMHLRPLRDNDVSPEVVQRAKENLVFGRKYEKPSAATVEDIGTSRRRLRKRRRTSTNSSSRAS